MEPAFWHKRWMNNQIGFHQSDINRWLIRYWNGLSLAKSAEVFVPLCGKSLDMRWLVENGLRVKGVECSRIAVEDFFREQSWPAKRTLGKRFERWQSKNMEIFLGDFFHLDADHLSAVQGVFDRAALIAFPAEHRTEYVAHLQKILPHRPPMLLVTLEYPQEEMNGPPFSVTEQEVNALYSEHYRIEKLVEEDIIDSEPRWRQAGLSSMVEKAYLLR